MPSVAVTGSIGSGKSVVCGLLALRVPCTTFSADMENNRLLASDPSVRTEILCLLGDEAYDDNGSPDREWIRERITSDITLKEGLESILHPRIRKGWENQASACRGPEAPLFLAEMPLLFENGLRNHFDFAVVVGCSESVRRERLASHRGMNGTTASRWLCLQMPQVEKCLLADHLIWNDGSLACLESQTDLLSSLILS
jgi:dephospho-CoA kinase